MSVLVEALSLVIRRITLDISYPGGADAFLAAMCVEDCPARRLCSDDKLVSVSFFTPDDVTTVVNSLRELGIVELEGNSFHELAVIDQREGPTLPCDWLEWRQHRDGFTYAWLAGTEPGDMAAPADWTAEQSRSLTRSDRRDEPGRMLKLGEDGEMETWLDFRTGAVTTGLKRLAERSGGGNRRDAGEQEIGEDAMAKREPWESSDEDDEDIGAEGLLGVVMAMLVEREIDHRIVSEDSVGGRIRTDKAAYELFITVDEPRACVFCYLVFPTRAPEHRRQAVAALIARANWRLASGSLDLDFSDGDVRFRCAVDVEDGVLTPKMLENIVSAGVWTLDTYHDALVRVMIAGEEPGAAFGTVAQ